MTAAELAELARIPLEPWQGAVLDAALAHDGPVNLQRPGRGMGAKQLEACRRHLADPAPSTVQGPDVARRHRDGRGEDGES